MTNTVHIAAVQMDVALADKPANLRAIESRLKETAAAGAEIVVFPECTVTGYCFESRAEALAVAEPVPGPATERLAAACKKLNVHAVVGLLELDGDRLFNACVLLGPGGLIGSYRKIHLPGLGVDKYVTAGDRPFAVHQAGDVRIGMNICYDASFPEAARLLALAGADVIVLPTNWPPGAQATACFTVNARAIENHVYYVACNRAGIERGFEFIGGSRICNPHGATLTEATGKGEQILYAEIDYLAARNKHLVREPGRHEIDRFADRRPAMYGPLAENNNG